jgi:DNA repair protein RecO (recombination protein O)
LLRPFLPINISYLGAQSLKNLQHVESGNKAYSFPELNIYCAYYINELIRYLLPEGEPYPDIFIAYLNCLENLQNNTAIEVALRCFEIQLMASLGYGLQLSYDVSTGEAIQAKFRYRFDIEQGVSVDAKGNIDGDTLIAMQLGSYTTSTQLQQAKQLMRSVIDFYLSGKTLKTRRLMFKLIPQKICKTL